MRVFIRQWPGNTATIMGENGEVIWTFSSLDEARKACNDWHNLVDSEPVFIHDEPDDRVPSAA